MTGRAADLPHTELLRLAASAERGSEHPLGEAIVRAAQARGLSLVEPEGFEAVTGRGIVAQVEGRQVTLGNLKLMTERAIHLNGLEAEAARLQAQAKTATWVAVDDKAVGLIAVADTIKPGSQEAIAEMHRLGLQVVMITGDNQATAEAIAQEAGIDPSSGFAQHPKQSERTRRSRFWVFYYNVVLIPVAMGVLYPFEFVPGILRSLHPVLAAFAMAFSSVTVVTNSLRLRGVRLRRG